MLFFALGDQLSFEAKLCFGMKGVVSRGMLFDINMIPHMPRDFTADKILTLVGEVLHAHVGYLAIVLAAVLAMQLLW